MFLVSTETESISTDILYTVIRTLGQALIWVVIGLSQHRLAVIWTALSSLQDVKLTANNKKKVLDCLGSCSEVELFRLVVMKPLILVNK